MTAARIAEEGVGENYDAAMMMETRARTFAVIDKIAAGVSVGMTEEAGREHALRVLADDGLLRGWHGVYVRFGENTLKNYDEVSAPGVVLAPNDIFFVDIGPVWQKWEGDGGGTFVVGDDPEMHAAQREVKVLFDRVQARWRADGLSGVALYDFADREAQAMGWRLNLRMAGHRLSDFPHNAHHKGTLAATAYAPSSGLWVLEIQIRHPTRPFGAFYEDLLLAD